MLKLRPMTERDLPEVFEMEQSIFTDAWSECALAETLQQEHSFILIAEDEHLIKGYAIFYFVLEEGDLARIAVRDSARREGVADVLLKTSWKGCKEKGVGRVVLEVRTNNEPAIGLYRKHGFKEIAIRKSYYHNPTEDGVMMCKDIT